MTITTTNDMMTCHRASLSLPLCQVRTELQTTSSKKRLLVHRPPGHVFCFQSKNSVASVVNAGIRVFRVFRQLLDPLGQGICQSCLECLCCRFLWAKTATSGCENGWSQCKKASIVQTPGAKGASSEPSCKESATETFVKYMKNQDSLPTKTSIQ